MPYIHRSGRVDTKPKGRTGRLRGPLNRPNGYDTPPEDKNVREKARPGHGGRDTSKGKGRAPRVQLSSKKAASLKPRGTVAAAEAAKAAAPAAGDAGAAGSADPAPAADVPGKAAPAASSKAEEPVPDQSTEARAARLGKAFGKATTAEAERRAERVQADIYSADLDKDEGVAPLRGAT